jgi:hypothetical protein
VNRNRAAVHRDRLRRPDPGADRTEFAAASPGSRKLAKEPQRHGSVGSGIRLRGCGRDSF